MRFAPAASIVMTTLVSYTNASGSNLRAAASIIISHQHEKDVTTTTKGLLVQFLDHNVGIVASSTSNKEHDQGVSQLPSETGSHSASDWPNASLAPSDTDVPSATLAPTEIDDGRCTVVTIKLRTDGWPEETMLTVEGETGTILDLRNLNANSDYSFSGCVQDDGCTVLGVTDTSGDGLLGDGFLTLTYGSEVLYDDWDLGFGFDMKLGNGCT